ncbi:MAG TPA: hypothetical protein VKV74_17730 [Bryobacteraceae bacterium]|nr:hypothetical protein [Bryobacteraceae bacterium]
MRHEDTQTLNWSVYKRFAIPYSFKPEMSVVGATIAAATAFLRIFLGSLLFSVCGVFTVVAWNSIRNIFLRIGLVAGMSLLFPLCLALLTWAISALPKRLMRLRR